MIILSNSDEIAFKQKFDILSDSQFATLASPIPFTPNIVPTDTIIQRFFVKKVNDAIITEVGSQNYYSLVSVGIYITTILNWQVRGIKNTITESNGVQDIGVMEFNLTQISQAESSMNGISKKLVNPLEFYQGIK